MDALPVLSRPFVMQTDLVGDQFLLPAGTVTFLLTDVEGSSRLWEERPAAMGAAIARHYELLDDAIAAHGGVRPVEQGEGDSVVAAFARAGDAVRAAIDAQRALTAGLPWLRVRMAVHTGEAQLRDEGNYVGRAIIRCARLRSCAHGGQILLSAPAAALAADDPGDADLVDLGTVRLRDLSRPERVWQVMAPGLPSDFAPLRSLDAAPHNLPAVLTSFIGREQELVTVTGLVREERLVTLTGSGGCGKTRLALHAAAELVEIHPGGTWWVDLAPVTTADAAAERVVGAVGASAAPGADTAALVVRHLRDAARTLVVIDNAEHVLEAMATLVDAVLAACPDVHVLVTSREPLGVAGELVWRVPSLRAPAAGVAVTPERLDAYEAARLFLDRARRVRPNLIIDDDTAAHVVAICSRLDGIPLALELAAARTRTVPLDRLARGLDDAFRLLTGGARTALPRQQTLLASIAWSVDLLDGQERTVLRRLAVFRGPFPLEAAEAVAADGATVTGYDVLDVISRLVDKSLVLLDDSTGDYRLLETIRQFSLDRLREAGELVSTRDRHTAWFVDWCESLDRGEHDFDIGPTHPMLPDVFAALDWAYATTPTQAYRIGRGLAGVWMLIGHYPDLDRLYAWLAARDGNDDPPRWAAAVAGLTIMGSTLQWEGFEELLARAEPKLDPRDTASRRYLRMWSSIFSSLWDFEPAEAAELTAAADADGDDHAAILHAIVLACGHVDTGRLDGVDDAVAVVRRLLARRGLPFAHHTALAMVGLDAWAAAARGELDRARTVTDTTGQPDATMILVTTCYAALIGYATGDIELLEQLAAWQADAEAAIAAEVTATNVPSRLEGPALHVHWARAVVEGRFADAIPLLRFAHERCPTGPAGRSYLLVPLATRLLAAGERDELDRLIDTFAADLARIRDAPLPTTDLHYLHALLARADGDLDGAWNHAHHALDIAEPAQLRLRAIDDLHLLGVLAHQRSQTATAARLLGAVTAERTHIGYVACELPDRDAVDAIEASLRLSEPAAWAEGETLDFADAIEFARRSRGERSRPTTGWASLTPTEQRVAAVVAQGHSNDEAARQLLMSVATVKTHLTHIYAKTGVTSRTGLAAALPRR